MKIEYLSLLLLLRRIATATAAVVLLSAPIDLAIAKTILGQPSAHRQMASIELQNRPTLFRYPLDVIDVRVSSRWQYRRSNYRFTIDVPEAAAKPLQTVTFVQIEGADYPRFSERRTNAYEGGDRGNQLNIITDNDIHNRTVTITFDPPIPPGRQIAIALNATNPRDGIYIYEVSAKPPDTTGLGQRIGIERLNFYQRSERRYF